MIIVVNTAFYSMQEYSVQLTFRQAWLDPRLSYSDHQGLEMLTFNQDISNNLFSGQIKYLTMTDPDKVWMPDTFFQNEKTGHFHNIIVPNVYVRIFPDGKVLYSIRSVCQYDFAQNTSEVMSVNSTSSVLFPEIYRVIKSQVVDREKEAYFC